MKSQPISGWERPGPCNTGPYDESVLVASGTITINNDGAIIENVDVTGIIKVYANGDATNLSASNNHFGGNYVYGIHSFNFPTSYKGNLEDPVDVSSIPACGISAGGEGNSGTTSVTGVSLSHSSLIISQGNSSSLTETNNVNVIISKYGSDTPVLTSLKFNGASHWLVKDITINPESPFPNQNVPLAHPVYPLFENSLFQVMSSSDITATNCHFKNVNFGLEAVFSTNLESFRE